ncbi:MAG: hypothetical protein OEW08_05975 [Gammaproteobacteria bacterium]|nr:hypothetical protein [Gammaproteobacteria bacterium]
MKKPDLHGVYRYAIPHFSSFCNAGLASLVIFQQAARLRNQDPEDAEQ